MRAGERGYALLLAIAVVAALAIAVLGSARALSDVTTSAARLQEGRTEIVAAESLMSRLTFALLTQETTARSVVMSDNVRRAGEELRLDGAWYGVNGARGAYVSVQDEAGLFNLNSADEQGLAALLAVAGAGNESLTLAARLMDYTDGDDFTRDRGAEGVTTNAPDCHHPPIGHSRRGGKRSKRWAGAIGVLKPARYGVGWLSGVPNLGSTSTRRLRRCSKRRLVTAAAHGPSSRNAKPDRSPILRKSRRSLAARLARMA